MDQNASSPSQLRTLLIGLDGACLDVLQRLFDDGAVPNIREVFEGGVGGPLESQLPPWTASAWPSIFTGVNPGKHGVFDFLTFDGYDWDVVNRSCVREYALWELLDEHGLSSVVVNVPVTHPPRPFDGALVPGYVAPDDPDCHPQGLLEEIRAEIGEYRVYNSVPDDASDAERVEEYRELVRLRGETFRYLAERFEPDFGFVQFQQTDTVFHELPGDSEAVRAVYEAVDREVGRLLEQCRPETVLIASDHGIGEYEGYGFRVNEYLRNHGYVETVRGGAGMPSWSSIAHNRLRNGDDNTATGKQLLARATALVARTGLTSQRAEALLDRVGLAEVVARHVPTDVIRAGTEQVDFPNSRAYMRSHLELGVRLNLAGREPDGVVAPEDYRDVRADLRDVLSAARTPDGEPVFQVVLPREEVFDGPYLEDAPDLLTVPAGFDHLPSASLLGAEFGPPQEPWNHKPVGVVAADGAAVAPEVSLHDAHIFDLAPTVLATLGVPASDRMDGQTLPIVESAGTQSYPAFTPQRVVETDDRAVEQRLADLGYLE